MMRIERVDRVSMRWVKVGKVRVRGRDSPRTNVRGRAKSLTLRKCAAPSGHDAARQALRELRRIIDAARHRIRRAVIPRHQDIRLYESRIRCPHMLQHQRGDHDVADALTIVPVAGIVIVWNGASCTCFMLHLRVLVVIAAIAEQHHTVSREHPQGDDGDEEVGAKATHEANR